MILTLMMTTTSLPCLSGTGCDVWPWELVHLNSGLRLRRALVEEDLLCAFIGSFHHPLQVRALAVCRAWRIYLDPRLLPIQALRSNGFTDDELRIAEWITVAQPALQCLRLFRLPATQLLLTLASVTPRTVGGWCSGCPGSNGVLLIPLSAMRDLRARVILQ